MRNPSSSIKRNIGGNGGGGGGTSGTPTPCCSKVGLKRGPWTPEEDEVLASYIRREGEGRWRTLPKRAGLLRCGKSCRLRWMNYLRPSVKRGQIAPDEEDLILRLHRLLGNRWSLIAGRIPGRTDNEIKNYWNTHLSKKLISQGIDPRTHKPLADPSVIPSCSKKSYLPTTITNNVANNNNNQLNPSTSQPCISIDPTTTQYHLELDQYQQAHNAFENPPDMAAATDHLIIKSNNDNNNRVLTGNNNNNEGYEEDDGMNYCCDDVFSSFLNSLINEDAFGNSQSDQPPSGLAFPSDNDQHALIPIAAAAPAPLDYGLGCSWEPSLLMPAPTFTPNDDPNNTKEG